MIDLIFERARIAVERARFAGMMAQDLIANAASDTWTAYDVMKNGALSAVADLGMVLLRSDALDPHRADVEALTRALTRRVLLVDHGLATEATWFSIADEVAAFSLKIRRRLHPSVPPVPELPASLL